MSDYSVADTTNSQPSQGNTATATTTTTSIHRFACPHPSCHKSFSRQEHLSRHKLNHWPKKIYRCTYVLSNKPGEMNTPAGSSINNLNVNGTADPNLNSMICNKTFVRKDLLVRHERRHYEKKKKRASSFEAARTRVNAEMNNENNRVIKPLVTASTSDPNIQQHVNTVHQQPTSIIPQQQNKINLPPVSQQQQVHHGIPSVLESARMENIETQPAFTTIYNSLDLGDTFLLNTPFFSLDPLMTFRTTTAFSNNNNTHHNGRDQMSHQSASLPNILNNNPQNGINGNTLTSILNDSNTLPNPSHIPVSDASVTSFENILTSNSNKIDTPKLSPNFFYPDGIAKYKISKTTLKKLVELIPDVAKMDINDLRKSIKSYWYNFHPQFALLHKPSFHINSAPPILILSMIMTGAAYIDSSFRETIADPICGPLRWIIFTHQDFQPPSATYIIQSLLLLETYEKSHTNRYFHERSYIHHGTTIQLLRRTPTLNDNPEKIIYTQDININNLQDIFHKWINYEMLKRVALYAFYMDTTHSVIFGYANVFISYNQVHLNMPCPDEIWETEDLTYETLIINDILNEHKSGYGTFLSSLRKLFIESINGYSELESSNPMSTSTINDNKSETTTTTWNIKSLFGKKLLLAGIMSIMFQCQFDADLDLYTFVTQSATPTTTPNMSIMSTMNDGTKVNGYLDLKLDKVDAKLHWRSIISFAVDYWYIKIQGSCTKEDSCTFLKGKSKKEGTFSSPSITPMESPATATAAAASSSPSNIDNANDRIKKTIENNNIPDDEDETDHTGDVFRLDGNDDTCKVSGYHMCQIILRIFQYDYYIFAGAPWRMSVKLKNNEYDVIRSRILRRSQIPKVGGISLVYAINFLFELLLIKDKETGKLMLRDYDSNKDSCESRSNSLGNIILLLWSFNFVQYGPEVDIWEDPNKQEMVKNYEPKEDILQYLTRLYEVLHVEDDIRHDVNKYHLAMRKKAHLIYDIKDKNNMCGLLKYMTRQFKDSYWELNREFSRLFTNCYERSLGKKSTTCYDLFETSNN